nr:hypothetical protein [Tanacetum cinerariifolium]
MTASVPYVRGKGLSSWLDLTIVLWAQRTWGSSSTQFLFPSPKRALMPSPRLLFALSTSPLDCGEKFEGNTKTKKVQKTLKQQYENFLGSSSESLEQIHDRLQKLISQLEIHRVSISQEDVNLKFLRSLPSEWRTHTLIWRNKTDLEEHSLDDLFNSLKIYEADVKSSSS